MDSSPIAGVSGKDRRTVEKAFLKPEEVAEYLSCTPEEIQSLIAKGVIPTVRLGDLMRIPRSSMESLTAMLQVALTIPSMEEDRWISPLDAANYLGITRKVVYRMIHRGELQAVATGGLWRIRQRVLQTHMLRQEQQAGAHPGENRTSRGIGRRRALAGLPRLPANEVLWARGYREHDHG